MPPMQTQIVLPTDDSLSYAVAARGPVIYHRQPFTGIAFEGHHDGSVSALTGYYSKYPHVIRRTASGDPTLMMEQYLPAYGYRTEAPVQQTAAKTTTTKKKTPAKQTPKKEPEFPGLAPSHKQTVTTIPSHKPVVSTVPSHGPAKESLAPSGASVVKPIPNVAGTGGVQVSHHDPSYRLDLPQVDFPSRQSTLITPPAQQAIPMAPAHEVSQSVQTVPMFRGGGEAYSSQMYTPTPADSQLGRGVQYEQLAIDPSDWNLNYADTLTRLLDALRATGQDVSGYRPSMGSSHVPVYTGPTIVRQPMNAW